MGDAPNVGPDIVVVGAARSATTYLASLLSQHDRIDPCSVKEPNYFSREIERGPEWYDRLFAPRDERLLRLDASVSYTFPHFPEALARLAQGSPDAFVVYVVREPISRALSHYQLHRDYFRNEPATTFGAAIESNDVYLGSSDYAYWLPRLYENFDAERVLLVPFGLATSGDQALLDELCKLLGIDPIVPDVSGTSAHRNEVVQFRHRSVARARRLVRRSGLYPWTRRAIGADRLRRLRHRLTEAKPREDLVAALDSCTDAQRAELELLGARAGLAAESALEAQDERLGLTWAASWRSSTARSQAANATLTKERTSLGDECENH